MPAPGPVARAFLPEPIRAAGLEFRAVTLMDWLLIERLGIPMGRILAEGRKPAAERDESLWDGTKAILVAWVLTHSHAEGRALLNRGRDVFEDTALGEIAGPRDILALAEIDDAIARSLNAAAETAMAYRSPNAKDGSVFTPPPGAATTAPDGSSMSSAT